MKFEMFENVDICCVKIFILRHAVTLLLLLCSNFFLTDFNSVVLPRRHPNIYPSSIAIDPPADVNHRDPPLYCHTSSTHFCAITTPNSPHSSSPHSHPV